MTSMTPRPITDWTDAELGRALLSLLARHQDLGGLSNGRSWESRLLEAAMGVLALPCPDGSINEWPDPEILIREAEQRHRARVLDAYRE